MQILGGAGGTYSGVAPTMGSATSAVGGWSATITNYDAGFTYSATTTAGSVSISGSTITQSGLSPSASSTVTVTTVRSGYESATGTVSGSALALPTIQLLAVGGGGGGAVGFNNGSVAASAPGGGGGGVYMTGVNGLALSQQGTYTVTVGQGGGNTGASPAGNGGNTSITNPSSSTLVIVYGGGGSSNGYPSGTPGTGGTGGSYNGDNGIFTANTWTSPGLQTNFENVAANISKTYKRGGGAASGGGSAGPAGSGDGGQGGGGGNPSPGGAGGSGVVSMKILTSNNSRITGTTGTASIYTDGTYTVYRWVSNGSFTVA